MIRSSVLGAAVSACLGVAAPLANAQARFITVEQGSGELEADRTLASRYLGRELVEQTEQFDYAEVIENLIADGRSGGIVARVTPYALVVAEMRGAKFEPIATCRSRSTGSTITNVFLVVRQEAFPRARFPSGPTLTQVLEYLDSLSDSERPATFIYHSKLSTSSYFFPSLFFRAQKVFAFDDESSLPDVITTIRSELHPARSSSELVKAVADGRADVASVWDGSRSSFNDPGDPNYLRYGARVWFVPLSVNLPCDVLVATRRVDAATRARIRDRLSASQSGGWELGSDSDVAAWVLWTDGAAGDARRALSELRRQAAASMLPVVVDVVDSKTAPAGTEAVEAVRLAIRLAGTELVDKSEYHDYYVNHDTRWELEQIHDGALRVRVRYDNFKLRGTEVTQQFDVSFVEPADLTRRVVSLVHTRLHRIRPIWPYGDTAPTVLRDVGFVVDTTVPFQEIEWRDLQRNDYRVRGEPREARLVNGDFNFELDAVAFRRRPDGRLDFEPMGRQAFRVLLMRPTPERLLFEVLAVAFVALFVLAAAGLLWEVWRWRGGAPLWRRDRRDKRRLDASADAQAGAAHAGVSPAAAVR